jgi:hypothetical protein
MQEAVAQVLAAIRPLTGLRCLNMGGNKVKMNVETIAANHPLLEELELTRAGLNDATAQVLLRAIGPLQMLSMVALSANYISDAMMHQLTAALPHVLLAWAEPDGDEDDVLSLGDGAEGQDEDDEDEEGDDGDDDDDDEEDSDEDGSDEESDDDDDDDDDDDGDADPDHSTDSGSESSEASDIPVDTSSDEDPAERRATADHAPPPATPDPAAHRHPTGNAPG